MSVENPYRPPVEPSRAPLIGQDLLAAIKTKELDFGEILRTALQLFKQNRVDFGLPTLFYALLMSAGYVLYMRFFMSGIFERISAQVLREKAGGAGATTPEEFIGEIGRFFGTMMLASFFFLFMQAFYNLYMTVRAGDRIVGPDLTPGDSLGQTLRRFIPYLFVSFLAIFPMMFGLVLCFVPGFVLMVYFSMLTPLVGIEKRGPSALSRCFSLLRNRFGKTFSVYFVAVAVFYGVYMIISIPLNVVMTSTMRSVTPQSLTAPVEMMQQMIDNPLFLGSMVLSSVLTTILYAFLDVVATVMYLNYSREERASDPATRSLN